MCNDGYGIHEGLKLLIITAYTIFVRSALVLIRLALYAPLQYIYSHEKRTDHHYFRKHAARHLG